MTVTPTQTHAVNACLDRIRAELNAVQPVAGWSTTRGGRLKAIADIHVIEAQLAALKLTMIVQADVQNDASEEGAVNTAALLRTLTLMPGPVASRTVKTARSLDEHPRTQEALAGGTIDLARATEVVKAVEALPSSVTPDERERAEQHMIELALEHDAAQVKQLGKHLVDVIDPDAADERLRKKLEAEERRAARKTYLEMWENPDGGWDGRFRLSGLAGDQLRRMLHAFTSPDRPVGPDGRIAFDDAQGNLRPTAERLGEAFEQLIARFPLDRVPKLRGRNATVVVTVPLETLLGGLAAAHVDTGRLLSPSAARCLAADAGIIPAVMGGDGAVLDLGPFVRFHDHWQRTAMAVQQGGTCAVEGCDRPAWWCDGAHLVAHCEGGSTSVEDGALICPRHHQMADSPKYDVQRIRPGRIKLVRRQ